MTSATTGQRIDDLLLRIGDRLAPCLRRSGCSSPKRSVTYVIATAAPGRRGSSPRRRHRRRGDDLGADRNRGQRARFAEFVLDRASVVTSPRAASCHRPAPYDRLADASSRRAARDSRAVMDRIDPEPLATPARRCSYARVLAFAKPGLSASIGTEALYARRQVAEWIDKRFGVGVEPLDVSAAIGAQGARGRAPALAAAPRHRHRHDGDLVPRGELPELRDGRHPDGCWWSGFPDMDVGRLRYNRSRPSWRNPGAVPVGEHPRNPAGRLDDLAWPSGARHRVPVFGSDGLYVGSPGATALVELRCHGALVRNRGRRGALSLSAVELAGSATASDLNWYLPGGHKHAGFAGSRSSQAAAVVALRRSARRRRAAGALPDAAAALWPGDLQVGIAAPLPTGFCLRVPEDDLAVGAQETGGPSSGSSRPRQSSTGPPGIGPRPAGAGAADKRLTCSSIRRDPSSLTGPPPTMLQRRCAGPADDPPRFVRGRTFHRRPRWPVILEDGSSRSTPADPGRHHGRWTFTPRAGC